MSTPTSTTSSSPPTTNRPDKTKKGSKVIILRLSPSLLSRYTPQQHQKESKSSPSSTSSLANPPTDIPTVTLAPSSDNASESNSTPAPIQDAPTPTEPGKKRKAPSLGTKRGLGMGNDKEPKQRGKPGPKKKPRLDDGTIDHASKPVVAPIIGPANPKLGPKANQGAINAGLRALDRSGKPCRKWNRKPFMLKSFTGVVWEMSSWKGGDRATLLNGDDTSDTKDISQQSSSDIKPTESDTAMDSTMGDQQEATMLSPPVTSSPAPPPVASAIVA